MSRKNPHQLKYTLINILTGSDLSKRRLALMEARSGRSGPVVWLTGAVHGDEVGGIVVIQEVFKRLKKMPLQTGSLHAFPLMNPIGFESASRRIPFSEEDLNRTFPGNENGSLAERIAYTIFQNIVKSKPTLVLDLHNDWLNSIPYALMDPFPGEKLKEIYEKTASHAFKTGLLVINEVDEKSQEEFKSSLSGSLINVGIPALSLELGEAYTVNEKNVRDGVTAIWRVLSSLKMVEPVEESLEYTPPEIVKNKVLPYHEEPLSSTSGVIRFLVNPGQIIEKKQPVVKIYNVFGKHRETIASEKYAIVLGLTDTAVALPGAPIIALGSL